MVVQAVIVAVVAAASACWHTAFDTVVGIAVAAAAEARPAMSHSPAIPGHSRCHCSWEAAAAAATCCAAAAFQPFAKIRQGVLARGGKGLRESSRMRMDC